MSQVITDKVISRIYGHGRGWCFSPKDFSDIGTTETVGRMLRRFAAEGTIRRLERGIFEYPKKSLLFDGFADPDMESVVEALARNHGWTLVPDENTSLNILGLSTQVPSVWIFLTNGPNRRYDWKWGILQLKKRSIKETAGISKQAAIIVHGLKGLGEDNISPEILQKLQKYTTVEEWKRILKETRHVTGWVHDIILQLCQGHPNE